MRVVSPALRRLRGVALVSALMVMVIIIIISSAFVTMTANDVRSSQTLGDGYLTLHLAEAGVDYALWITKHNMSVYPMPLATPVPATRPRAYDTGITTVDQLAPGVLSLLGGEDLRGSVVTVPCPETAGVQSDPQEYVLISDLSFNEGGWLMQDRYCGTFQVKQVVASHPSGDPDQRRLTITSIGRVRMVPQAWNWSTSTLNKTTISTTDFRNVRAQRTLNAVVDIDSDPKVSAPSKMREIQWYERFR